MKKYLRINEKDNCIVALETINKGDVILNVEAMEEIKKGHKMAIFDIEKGKDVIKYGNSIGRAKENIKAGEHIHTHNITTNLDQSKVFSYEKVNTDIKKNEDRKVKVYLRRTGEVGIRNEIWVIPTVGCINNLVKTMANKFMIGHPINSSFDGCFAYTHPYGCSQLGDDHINTKTAIIDMMKHPNNGGVLVVGLGCENNQIKAIINELGYYNEKRVKFLICQESSNEITDGLKLLEEIYEEIKNDIRVDQPLSKITIGLKCGGSDGMSGITANPLIGKMSDYMASIGGSSILTEIPEMFGAEQMMFNRCENKEIYQKLYRLVDDFKNYYAKNNQVIYENPSPGNKEGGISTLEDKSLGCIEKSGSSSVKDILRYGERIKTKGLNILEAPGNDLVAATATALSGAQLILFSTGRGTPYGTIVPTIKVSTNSELFLGKRNWIDFDAGIINQENSNKVFEDFKEYIIGVIEGKYTKNEINDCREIAIFKTGVTL